MFLVFLKWLFQSDTQRPQHKPFPRMPAQDSHTRPAGTQFGVASKQARSYSPAPKLSDKEDDDIRQRLVAESQRKREQEAQWEQAALHADFTDKQQHCREEWLREYSKYHRTPEWGAVRASVLEKANHTCSQCGGTAVVAHHVRYPSGYGPTLDDFISNEDESLIVAVCHACHATIHSQSINAQKEWRQSQQPEGLRVAKRRLRRQRTPAVSAISPSKSDADSSHLPKRPKRFMVKPCGQQPNDSSVCDAPPDITHLATIAFRNTGRSSHVEEYWLGTGPDTWVIYRVSPVDEQGPVPSRRQWKRFAIASRGPEEIRAAAVYMLHDAWKADATPSTPTLVETGICTLTDIRWIFSQAWPSQQRISQQRPKRGNATAQKFKKKKRR